MVKLTEQESVKIVKDLRLYMKDGIFTAERIQTKLKQECIQDELRGMMDIEDVWVSNKETVQQYRDTSKNEPANP